MGARILSFLGLLLITTVCFAQRLIKHAEQEFLPLRDGMRHMYDSLILAGDSSVYQEGGDYTEYRKWEEFWSLRLKDGDSFTDYERAYARSREAADLKSAESNTTDWHEVGPKDIPFGNVQLGQGSGYGIGPIRFLTLNSQYPDTMLCGSHSGGLFYTEDEGLNWRMAGSDTWARTGCQYAVFNAADPCIWYAANSGYWGYAGGIYRTLDCGETWELIANHGDFYSGGVWTSINQLIPDHTDPSVLYATSEHQLWRTNNANDTDPIWEVVEIPLPSSIDNHPTYGNYWFSDARNVYDMVLDPIHNDTMYVAARFEGILADTVKVRYWRLMSSFDSGETWNEVPGQPSHSFTIGIPNHRDEFQRWDRNAEHLTIEGTRAYHDRLHILYDLTGYQVDEVWRSTAISAGTWDSSPLSSTIEVLYGGGHGFGVSQVNGEDVYLDHNRSGTSIGRYQTFVNGQWYDYYDFPQYGNRFQYHVDVEDFVGHPTEPGEIWLADHGGIHKSTDSGQSWEWRGRGLAVAEPWRITDSYADDDHILMGLFHEATVLSQPEYSPEWVPEWRQLRGGDGQKPIIDPDEPNKLLWSSQGNYWYSSANYGQSSTQLTGIGPGDWNTEGAMDRGVPNAVYIPAWFYDPVESVYYCEIRRSFDHVTTTELISDFYPLVGANKWIWRLYPAWSNPNILCAYFPDGPRLMRTTAARATAAEVRNGWHQINGALPRTDAWVSDIDFDFDDPNVLYIAYSSSSIQVDTSVGTGMLYRIDCSDTSNVIVTDLTGSDSTWSALPNTGIGSEGVSLERGSDGGIYVGTDVGVFYINNKLMANGEGWQLLGSNLPHAQCRGLLINYKANRLRAGIYGRGLWEHGLWCPDSTDLVETGTYPADVFQEATNAITSTAVVDSSRVVTYRGGQEVRMMPGFHATAGSTYHAFIHPCDIGGNSFKSSRPGASAMEVQERFERATVAHSIGRLFPNPNSGRFSIANPERSVIASIRAFDATGREVWVRWVVRGDSIECEVRPATDHSVLTLQVSYPDGRIEHHRTSIFR